MTLILGREEVESLLNMEITIRAVENAFKEMGEGRIKMPPRIPIVLEEYSGATGFMPAYIEKTRVMGIKIMSHYGQNPQKFNLPYLIGLIVLSNPETGYPYAIMDAGFITTMRTGAAGAVGAKYLSRKDSEIAGVIGLGDQGKSQIVALDKVRKIRKVKAYDISKESQANFAKEMRDKIDSDIEIVESAKMAVKDVDILITCTPSTRPIVKGEWIDKGTHITAIGADMPEKEELYPNAFEKIDKIVVDSKEQAIITGELSIPISEEVITENDIYSTIGEIVAGKKAGREHYEEITLFKSTGLAIQDISTAYEVYKRAKRKRKGTEVEII